MGAGISSDDSESDSSTSSSSSDSDSDSSSEESSSEGEGELVAGSRGGNDSESDSESEDDSSESSSSSDSDSEEEEAGQRGDGQPKASPKPVETGSLLPDLAATGPVKVDGGGGELLLDGFGQPPPAPAPAASGGMDDFKDMIMPPVVTTAPAPSQTRGEPMGLGLSTPGLSATGPSYSCTRTLLRPEVAGGLLVTHAFLRGPMASQHIAAQGLSVNALALRVTFANVRLDGGTIRRVRGE